MKFIRKSLGRKAFFLFALFLIFLFGASIYVMRFKVLTIDVNTALIFSLALLFCILIIFLADVVWPLERVTRQVKNLLTGKTYTRVTPITIDEVGVVTHFFNEITRDLEKISYDLKERRRMSSELDIASKIQRDVLPKETPEAPSLDIIAKNRPAAEIGGDNFDFILAPDGDNVFIYVGDVTGHGVPAGLVMMMVNILFRAMISRGVPDSREAIVNTNLLLTPRISTRLFMTAVMLRWNKAEQKMYYTGAGHEHILIHRAKNETVEAIRSGGIALGMIQDISRIVQEKTLELSVGDTIVLFSDGITEAKNQAGEMYTLKRLVKSLEKHGYLPSAESIHDRLTEDFSDFVEEYIQIDDITLIVIKYLGKDAVTKKVKLVLSSEESLHPTIASKKWDWGG